MLRIPLFLLALLALAACTTPEGSGLGGGPNQYIGGPTPSIGGNYNPVSGLPASH